MHPWTAKESFAGAVVEVAAGAAVAAVAAMAVGAATAEVWGSGAEAEGTGESTRDGASALVLWVVRSCE